MLQQSHLALTNYILRFLFSHTLTNSYKTICFLPVLQYKYFLAFFFSMSLAVKRAARQGAVGPSYVQTPALALQPDPRHHAQAQRGSKAARYFLAFLMIKI